MEETREDGRWGKEFRHETYGVMGFNRAHGSESALFGSSLKHRTVITMTLKHARLIRSDLHQDWVHGEEVIVEVMMSPSQFADLITGLNQGDGVPVTIHWLPGRGYMDEPPYHSKVDEFQEEFSDEMAGVAAACDGVIAEAQRRKLPGVFIKELEMLRQKIKSGLPFAGEQFTRQMHRTVNEAKAEVESFVRAKIEATGIEVLKEQSPRLKEGETTPWYRDAIEGNEQAKDGGDAE